MTATSSSEFREAYHGQIRTDVIPHVPSTGGKLLDIGGGIGATAAYLKMLGHFDAAGVADMIAPDAALPDLDFGYQCDLQSSDAISNIVAQQGHFDVILALDVLEHLPDPWAMIENIHRALKSGGFLVASIPNIRNFTASFPLLFKNEWDYADAGILDRTHLRFFVKETAISLATSSGMKPVKVAASPSGGRKIRLLRQLTLGLFNSFTDRQYVIVVQKS